jgi:hypothetical protein
MLQRSITVQIVGRVQINEPQLGRPGTWNLNGTVDGDRIYDLAGRNDVHLHLIEQSTMTQVSGNVLVSRYSPDGNTIELTGTGAPVVEQLHGA